MAEEIHKVKIQVRRGVENELTDLSTGEPALSTDTTKFFVGTGNGNKSQLAKQSQVDTIQQDVTNAKTNITSLQTDNGKNKTDITQLKTDTTGLRTDLNEVINDVGTLGTTVETNSTDINTLKGTKTEVEAARGTKVSLKDRFDSLEKAQNEQTFECIANQDTFVIANGSYTPNTKTINVYIEGSLIARELYTEVDSKTIKLNTPRNVGDLVTLIWLEGKLPVAFGHNTSHYKGGQDEIDVTKLTNFKEEVSDKIEILSNKQKFLFETDNTDISDLLISLIANTEVNTVDLAGKKYVVSKLVTLTNTILRNGTITLKNTGQFSIKDDGRIENVKLVMNQSTLTSPSVLLFEKMNGYANKIKIEGDSTTPVNTIGVHVRGTSLTCFNEINNVHIRRARVGAYIDATAGWATSNTFDNIRVDYFEEYAFRIGASSGNYQNSQHNINNLVIQDTSDNTEASSRIGLSAGGTWNNISNVITFGDRATGTFTPFHIPKQVGTTPSSILATLLTSISNSITNMVLESDPQCNGMEYLHNIENTRLVRSKKVPPYSIGTTTSWTLPSTSDIKPLFTLKDSPEIVISTTSQTNEINTGNITFTNTNGVITIKNNVATARSFTFYIKVPASVSSKIKYGKYSTVLSLLDAGHSGSLRSTSTRVTEESINHLTTTSKGRISFYACENNTDVLTSADSNDLLYAFGFGSIAAGSTVTIREFQFYNQLVPVLNKNTISWLDTTSLLS